MKTELFNRRDRSPCRWDIYLFLVVPFVLSQIIYFIFYLSIKLHHIFCNNSAQSELNEVRI